MAAIVGIIPARYLSTRFPGKPLIDIDGKSMIRRVYEQSIKSNQLKSVYVATDDQRIYDEVVSNGGKAVMTNPLSINGTERCFEAYDMIKEIDGEYNYLVNIQGDEPFIDPEEINEVCNLIKSTDSSVATLVSEIQDENDLTDPNVVKAIRNIHGRIIYFSRTAIPFIRGVEQKKWLKTAVYYKHIGIYAFKTTEIDKIRQLKPSPLEQLENLEQLRWIENGIEVASAPTSIQSIAIDTPDDLQKAIKFASSKD